MLRHWQAWKWQLQVVKLLIFCGTIVPGIPSAIAQNIATDGTLGPERVLAGPNYLIPQSDGLTVRNNLFQSFSRFNIGTGESAIFESAANIRNIFSRVTGGSPSLIDGLLSTQNRDVNLFLMNPSGVIFGSNAQLNIGSSTRGSFVVATVDALMFPNGDRFSARNPEAATGLLRIVGDPSGFIAGQQVPGVIQNSGSLSVKPSQSLLFLGGDISLIGKGLSAPGGHIEIASIADGQVDLAITNNALSLTFQDEVSRKNASLNGSSLVTSSAGNSGTGNISIYAKDIITNNASLRTTVVGSQNSGNVTLDASDTVSLTNSSISTQALSFPLLKIPTGNAGSVQIKANNSIKVVDRSNINTSSIDKNSGDIQIETMGSLRLSDTVLTSQSNQGNAGNVTLKAGDVTSISKGSIDTATGSLSEITSGNSGNISIETGELSIDKDTRMSTAATGAGQGGNITFTVTKGSLNLANSEIRTRTNNRGNAGNIVVTAADSVNVSGTLSNVSIGGLYTSTEGDGKAGNIAVTSNSVRVSDNAVFDAQTSAGGVGGTIEVTAQTLEVSEGGQLRTITSGSGRAGEIIANVSDRLSLSGNGTQISASTSGSGDAGNVSLLNTQNLSIRVSDGARVSAETFDEGKGGSVTVTANSLDVLSGGQLRTATSGSGNAGDITADVRDRITLSGSGSGLFVNTTGSGNAGNLNLKTQNLSISDGAQISASTSAQGVGGSVTVNTQDLSVNNGAQISATTSGEGAGGSVTVTTNTLEATSGGKLVTDASQTGKAGDITANVRDRITLSGDGTQISASTSGRGDAGNLALNTQDLSVSDRAQVSATTSDQGTGGNIVVKARSFVANSGGQLRTTTSGSGNAGSITATIEDKILLAGTGSGMFANTTRESSGNGGNITIDPQTVVIRDGARVAVDSQGSGQGGNIQIQAENLTLDNRGQISAETVSSQGGNINLQVGKILLLRRGSQISTTAGTDQAGGDGGNIRINALFVAAIPKENSDITANAFTGRGGRVDITTRGLFGIAPAVRLTSLSDITASSEFGISGVITINTPDVDPSRGLAQLPETPVDPSNQIRQACRPAGTQQASSFVVTGRGGIPISPERAIQQTPLTGWVTVDGGDRGQQISQNSRGSQNIQHPTSNIQNSPIVEAQGWVKDAKGNVWLVSNVSATSAKSAWEAVPACP